MTKNQAGRGKGDRRADRQKMTQADLCQAGPQDDQHTDEADDDGGPAMPADTLAQHRPRQRRDDQGAGE